MIIATPYPDAQPPSVVVAVAVPAGAVMQSVAVYRTDGGVKSLLRQQPSAGFDSREVTDFEAPFGVPLVYSWETSYVDPSGITQVWTEPWASLASWTVVGASWSVSGGKLIWSGSDDPTASVTRTLTPGLYRVLFAAPPVGIVTLDLGGVTIDIAGSRLYAGGQSVAIVPGTGSWVIDVTDTSVTLVTTAGTFSVQAAVQVSKVAFVGAVSTMAHFADWTYPTGSGTGQITPNAGDGNAIAVDTAGNLHILDILANRVLRFSPTGTYLGTYSGAGATDGLLVAPQSIAIDSANNVFVIDVTYRIQKFVPSGGTWVYSTKYAGSYGTGNGQFGGSQLAIAVDATSRIYVADRMNHRVQRFTAALAYLDKVGSNGTALGQFQYPRMVAVSADGSVFVGDYARVQKFSSTFTAPALLAPQGTTLGSIYLAGQVVARGSNVYVIDKNVPGGFRSTRIQKFTQGGTLIGSLLDPVNAVTDASTEDSGDGNPYRMAVSPTTDDIFIIDPDHTRVRRFAQAKASIDDVTASIYGPPVFLTESTPPITLDVTDAWLIHPAEPALSIQLPDSDLVLSGIESQGAVSNKSNATVHRILGSATPITTTTGPRSDDETNVAVRTSTDAGRLALRAILADDIPLLFQIPASWTVGFTSGFYQVGDVTAERVTPVGSEPTRSHMLPLTKVQSPIVTVTNTGWSYAAVALEFASYDAVKAAFASDADLASDTRAA